MAESDDYVTLSVPYPHDVRMTMSVRAPRLRLAAVTGSVLLVVGGGAAFADGGPSNGATADGSAAAAAPASQDANAPAGPSDSAAGAPTVAGPDGAQAPSGQVKVIVRSKRGPAAAAAAVRRAGGAVSTTLSLIGGVTADVPTANVAALSADATVQAVSNDAGLSLAPADATGIAGGTAGPDDASVTPQQAAHLIGADAAYARGLDGSGVDVAVLDTGVVPVAGLAGDHTVLGADLSTEADSPLKGLDGFGHGTAMAGIVAANGPGQFRGVAPGARVVSVKVGAADGSVDVSQVIAGIDWVVQHKDDAGVHVRVLNLSFGTESPQAADLDPLAYAADVAWRHGIVVVTSVGNDGRTDRQVSDPAINPSVLAVGAADTHGSSNAADATVAPFSSLGDATRHADLLAPGVHMVSLRDPGSTLDQAFPAARRGDDLFRGSGTSHAAAVVSGAVALLLQQRPGLTPDQVKALLVRTADRLPNARPVVQGAGLVDLAQALATPTPKKDHDHPRLHGTGSLEQARGGVHLLRDGTPVTGEQTVLGSAWDGRVWAPLAWQGSTWQGSTWQGSTWQGSTWQGSTWQGSTWQGSTWQGSTWQGSTWQGSTWQGSTWQGSTWQGLGWAGATWV